MEVLRLMCTRLVTWERSTRTSSELCFVISSQRTRKESSTQRASTMDSKSLRKMTQWSKVRSWRRVALMPRLQQQSERVHKSQPPTIHIPRRVRLPSLTIATLRSTKWRRLTHRLRIWTRPATISSLAASKSGTDSRLLSLMSWRIHLKEANKIFWDKNLNKSNRMDPLKNLH